MEKIILIKFGGSLITDKKKYKSVRLDVVKRLCKEINEASLKSKTKIFLGNGGGSYNHPPSIKYNLPSGITNNNSLRGISEVQDLGSQLNRIVVRELIDFGCNAISINPSSCMVTSGGVITEFFVEPILMALNSNMLPVVYGDVLFDRLKGCSDVSTESIFNYIAPILDKYYKVEKIIYCGETDGVYDSSGKTIDEINKSNIKKYLECIKGSEGMDVTGGMEHKVEESLKMADLGIDSQIINAKIPGALYRVIMGEKSGTLITRASQSTKYQLLRPYLVVEEKTSETAQI